MKIAISISTQKLAPFAVSADTVACLEAMQAILSAVDLEYVPLSPRCRVLRQGKLANMRGEMI